MLVITLKESERVVITVPMPGGGVERIEVELCRIGSLEKAKLGIQAPRHVKVLRKEIENRLPVAAGGRQ